MGNLRWPDWPELAALLHRQLNTSSLHRHHAPLTLCRIRPIPNVPPPLFQSRGSFGGLPSPHKTYEFVKIGTGKNQNKFWGTPAVQHLTPYGDWIAYRPKMSLPIKKFPKQPLRKATWGILFRYSIILFSPAVQPVGVPILESDRSISTGFQYDIGHTPQPFPEKYRS